MSTEEAVRLYTQEPLSYADIGRMVHPPISRERVRQILTAAGVGPELSFRRRAVEIRMKHRIRAQEEARRRKSLRRRALIEAVEAGDLKRAWKDLGYASYNSATYTASYLGLSLGGKPRKIPARDRPVMARAAINGEMAKVWRGLGYANPESALQSAKAYVVRLHGLRMGSRKALYFLRDHPGSTTAEVESATGARLTQTRRPDLFEARGTQHRFFWHLTKRGHEILREWDKVTRGVG